MKEIYTQQDKIYDILANNAELLQVISRFSIPLGVQDKTVEEICRDNSLDCSTFLAIINFTKSKGEISLSQYNIDLNTIMLYLKNTHNYYSSFLLPFLRRNLIDAIGLNPDNDITFLIIKFYDEYCNELTKHMERENNKVFTYVDDLLNGKISDPLPLEISLMHRSPIEQKISELKNIIIKYYSHQKVNNLLNNILYYLIHCEEDLAIHCLIEERIFLPEIKNLENKIFKDKTQEITAKSEDSEYLTDREKEMIVLVAKGLTNKEIADRLFISVNTVTTHRRNIARKLDIHSPSGLTIYAIVNQLVDIKEIKF